jgi:zinc protease
VRFQFQGPKSGSMPWFRALCTTVFALWLLFAATPAQAQSPGPSPIVAKAQDDLSLLAGPILTSPPGGPQVQTNKPSSVWPWEISGETPDPAIRFGRLRNGMRYAIKPHNKPEKEVAIRFRYAVGSNHEEDDQLGYAHFLEHMAFNGSTNVPEGDFVKRMERLGAAFGRHVNASTGTDETTYQFNLPNAEEGRLELALDLLRETADRLTLSQDAIDREKGIVASEQITRSSPMRDQYLERNKLLYPRVRSTLRDPIGTKQSIEAATSQRLRSFYQRWYRPERALLVIVGAVDVDTTEALIKDRFSSWKPALDEPDPPDPGDGQWEDNKLLVHIERSSSAPEAFIIESERPDPRLFETGTRDEASIRNHVQTLAFNILNGRLHKAATRGDNPPYLSGSYGGPFGGPANSRGMGWRARFDFEPSKGDWRRGMKAIALEMRQVLRDGFSQEDRDRAVADYTRVGPTMGRPDVFDGSAQTASFLTSTLANGYTPKAKENRATRRAELLRHVEQVTVERLNEEVRFYWQGVQPRFLITTQDPSVTEASVIAVWREILAAPIPPRQTIRPVKFEPLKLRAASRLAGKWREPGLDADFVRFENGVTLVVKTNAQPVSDSNQSRPPDEVAISVQFGAGWLAFGDGDGIWSSIANVEWERAGFANLKAADLADAFQDTSFSGINTDFSLARTRMRTTALKADLDLVLDVMLAKVVAPRLGTDSTGLFADRLRQGLGARQQTAQDVFRQHRASLYQTGSPLFAPRTPEQMLAATLSTDVVQANARLRTLLDQAPITVMIVGDIDTETATKAVAGRFGALPRRRGLDTGIAVARQWRLRDGGGPAHVFQHEGKEDQALVNVAWQVPDIPEGPKQYALRLLQAVFQIRAIDVIREAYGLTYSPSVQVSPLLGYGDHVVLSVSAIVLPKDVQGVEDRIVGIARELATHGPSEDEVSRARTPLLEAQSEECKANDCWIGKMSTVLANRALGERHPRPWRNTLEDVSTLKSLTKETLQTLAQRYLVDTRLIKAHVLPGPNAGKSASEPDGN